MFPSEIAQGLIQGRDPSKEDPSELRFIPAKRFGGEEEMAGTVLYLASRAGAVSIPKIPLSPLRLPTRRDISPVCFIYLLIESQLLIVEYRSTVTV